MPYRYSPEFRRKVLDLLAAGRSVASLAADLGVSDQTIYNWRRQDAVDRGVSSRVSPPTVPRNLRRLVLSYSGRFRAWISSSQAQAHLVEGIYAVLGRLGGTARRWRVDRMATVLVVGANPIRPSLVGVVQALRGECRSVSTEAARPGAVMAGCRGCDVRLGELRRTGRGRRRRGVPPGRGS